MSDTPSEKKPWYLRWWGIALIALFVIGFLSAIFDDEETEMADALEEVSEAAEEAPTEEGWERDPTSWPDRPEPSEEPDEEPTREQHDWASVDAYIADMSDSTTQIAELLDLVGQTADMYGRVPDDEVADAFDVAAFVIGTHIEHFDDTTPPPGFEEPQRLMLDSWLMFQESWTMAGEATRTEDPELLFQALELMEQGTAKINEATAALPNR